MIAPWITVEELADDVATTNPELAQEAVEAASYVLWLLSARKFGGVRTTTEIYCQMGLDEIGLEYPVTSFSQPGYRGWQVWPVVRYGSIYNMIGGCCSECGCTHLIRLRGGPILSVESVRIGSRSLAPDEIAIYDYSCISAGNRRCWWSCDDVEVTYTYGANPPSLGKMAARQLADQYVLAMTGDDACTLPERVTSVSRQGVSWTLLDPQDFLDRGRTGLYRVDLFLRAVNPDQARLRARVFSPDKPRAKTRRDGTGAPMPMVMGFGPTVPGSGTGPTPMTVGTWSSTPSPTPMAMSMSAPTTTSVLSTSVPIYEGRPLRWVVPGAFTAENAPVVTVRPSGREVPPDALLWRTNNYTLDLTAEQVAELLPPGSVLVVSSTDDMGRTTGSTSYPVERRTS